MAPNPSIIWESPTALVAAIPHLLGLPPQQSIVVVALGEVEEQVNVAGIARYPRPLDAPDGLGELAHRGYAERIVGTAAQAGSTNLIVTVWGDQPPNGIFRGELDLPHKEIFDSLDDLLDEGKLDGFEMVYTTGDRTWSYNCQDDCCGAHLGLPVRRMTQDQFAAEIVTPGQVMKPDQAEITAEFAYTQPDDVMHDLGPSTTRALYAATNSPGGREKLITTLHDLAARGGPFNGTEIAFTARTLTSIKIRDTFLWDLNQQGVDQQPAIRLLTEVVRSTPDEHVAPAATVLAIAHYTAGDSPRAHACITRALTVADKYSLAQLMDRALRDGVDPKAYQAALQDLNRETCLGTAPPPFNPSSPSHDNALAEPAQGISLER